MKQNRFKDDNGHSYWQSTTDALTGLVLMLMLILIMFMVRVIYFSQYDGENEYKGQGDANYEVGFDYEEGDENYQNGTNSGSGAGSGGNHGDVGGQGENETMTTVVESGCAAIKVEIVDEDSNVHIRQANVEFQLYDSEHQLVELYTYYPEKQSYDTFSTKDDGTFYLPEKIKEGTYTLRNITTVDGYELAEDVSFEVDQEYDWADPLIITSYVGAEKNNLFIQLVDSNGDKVLEEETLDIYAYEDITAEDGTIQYKKNELIDTIITDSNGYGASKAIFLGKYLVKLNEKSDVYATSEDSIVTVYPKNSDEGNLINSITVEKTTIEVQLVDELDNSISLSGAEFELKNTKTGDIANETTSASGYLAFTDLSKNTTYELKQTKFVGHYMEDDTVNTIYVDENGLINNEPSTKLVITNRLIRVSLNLVDTYLNRPLSKFTVNVYDSSNSLVLSYKADESSKEIEGLEDGEYIIEVEGTNRKNTINVKNTAKKQSFEIEVKVQIYLYLLIAIIVILSSVIAYVIHCIWKKRKKNGGK